MLVHRGTQSIRTDRLILRRFTENDAQAMFDTWASDVRVTRYMTWEPHTSVEVTKQLLKLWCEAYQDDRCYRWAIELGGKLIGNIDVVRLGERSEQALLGYCMGYDYWNRGLMTEAASAVIEYLFQQIGMNRITIRHAVKNPASGRVAQKCGMIKEGVKRQDFKANSGEFLDVAEYAILRSEWAEVVK